MRHRILRARSRLSAGTLTRDSYFPTKAARSNYFSFEKYVVLRLFEQVAKGIVNGLYCAEQICFSKSLVLLYLYV